MDNIEWVKTVNTTLDNTIADNGKKWNTEAAAAFFAAIVDAAIEARGTDELGEFLRPTFHRYANLNAVYNRLLASGDITKGDGTRSSGGLGMK